MRIRLFAALAAPLAAAGLAACTVEKTNEDGELPEYEVEPAKIDIDWDTTTVRTPDIDIIPRDTMRDTLR